MIFELLVQFFENGVPVSKPELVQVCPDLRVKSITERGYEESDDSWFYGTNIPALRRDGTCVSARWDDSLQPYPGSFYDAKILCSANAGEAYSSSVQYQNSKLEFRAQWPPYRGKGRYADLTCRQVDEDLIS